MDKNKDKGIDIEPEDMYNGEDVEMLGEEIESNFELKFKKLREKLKECEKVKGEYLDGWQRSKAEFLNNKKASIDERGAVAARAEATLIQEILPILDSFDFAFSKLPEDIDPEHTWVKGVSNIQSQIQNILKGLGVVELNPVGDPFDPFLHESIGTLTVGDKKKDNTVVEVFQKGYEHKGIMIRPPKVRVAEYT